MIERARLRDARWVLSGILEVKNTALLERL